MLNSYVMTKEKLKNTHMMSEIIFYLGRWALFWGESWPLGQPEFGISDRGLLDEQNNKLFSINDFFSFSIPRATYCYNHISLYRAKIVSFPLYKKRKSYGKLVTTKAEKIIPE